MNDWSKVVAEDARPAIGHEFGQWTFFPDFNEIKKWTGVMALKNFEIVRDDMAKKHLLNLAQSMWKRAANWQWWFTRRKSNCSCARRDYGGFSLLALNDYPKQGMALVGPFDPFWDSKGFIAPERFRQFCGPTVPLLRMPKRTYTSDEPFEAKAEISHFGAADLNNAQPVWDIKDETGRVVASGKFPPGTLTTGKLTELGAIKASLASAPTPGKLTVTVSLQGTLVVNSWEIWVYPADIKPTAPAGVIVCDEWNDAAKAALAEGKKVFLMATSVAHSLPGSFRPVFWTQSGAIQRTRFRTQWAFCAIRRSRPGRVSNRVGPATGNGGRSSTNRDRLILMPRQPGSVRSCRSWITSGAIRSSACCLRRGSVRGNCLFAR